MREKKRKQHNVEIMPTSIPVRSIDGSDYTFLFFLFVFDFFLLSSEFKCSWDWKRMRKKELYSSNFHQGSALTAHVVVCLMIFD